MRPELVLNEDDKKRRFKKFLMKKVECDSNVISSRRTQYSDDMSLNVRALEMTLIEPTERQPKSPNQYSEVVSFPHPFPVSTSSTYSQSMFPSKHLATSPACKRYKAHKTKYYIRSVIFY